MNPLAEAIPVSVEAALCFTDDGQYWFGYTDPQRQMVVQKYLSPKDVISALSERDPDSGWFTGGLVRKGYGPQGEWRVFSRPPRVVRMTILFNEERLAIMVPLPHLVFLVYGRRSFVWAIRKRSFTPNAAAFHAPFPNVYGTGAICWGGNQPPQAETTDPEGFWQKFLAAPFNQELTSHKSVTEREDVRRLWLRLSEIFQTRRCAFPAEELLPVSYQPVSIGYVINKTLYPDQIFSPVDGSMQEEEEEPDDNL